MSNKIDLASFQNGFKGTIIKPEDDNYDEARKIWNAVIDRKPELIVQVAESNDVITAIESARKNNLDITVRGAGHNIAGNSIKYWR